MKKVIVIGAGLSGLTAASYLAQNGFKVTVFEKNEKVGGRLRVFEEEGFKFDMGPSWYWMPEVFEKFYNDFQYKTTDFYDLIRLEPSYRVFWEDDDITDLPSDFNELKELFDRFENGAGEKLQKFLDSAKIKYEVGMLDFASKPSHSILEYIDIRLLLKALKLDILKSVSSEIKNLFSHSKLIRLLEFPVLFLGAKPENTPSMYSMMNYADMKLGTWYPVGGMVQIASAFEKIAKSQGVEIITNCNISNIKVRNNEASIISTDNGDFETDELINAADYHYVEQQLLPKEYRMYDESYWNNRVLAPTAILFFVGLNKKIKNLLHHNLFFDADFKKHSEEIYETHKWPENPLFYVSVTSKTDETAPDGCENLFILIPISTELIEKKEIIDKYFNIVLDRIEKRTGENLKDSVIFRKDFTRENFIESYNSFKGNAYGLANTLMQTAFLKPKMRNKKLSNFYNVGQLTVPGPGLPPAIISGRIAFNEIVKNNKNKI